MNLSQRIEELATRIATYIKEVISPKLLPEGGIDGQILTKTVDGYSWTDAPTTDATAMGVTTTFTTPDGKTVSVQDGIVVEVYETPVYQPEHPVEEQPVDGEVTEETPAEPTDEGNADAQPDTTPDETVPDVEPSEPATGPEVEAEPEQTEPVTEPEATPVEEEVPPANEAQEEPAPEGTDPAEEPIV